jgi:hypothetical protein
MLCSCILELVVLIESYYPLPRVTADRYSCIVVVCVSYIQLHRDGSGSVARRDATCRSTRPSDGAD